MYERHFGFTTKPFALTPDPTFLYPSRQHTMATTMLEYGLESQAPFSLLTGDIGSGKTTLVRRLLRDLDERVAVGLVSNTHSHFKSVHGWALSALGIGASAVSEVAQYETLVKFLVREYAKDRRTLLIFDEAQNLSMEALEELRLLSNVNSERDLILQILLVGQPELRTNLLRPELRQFAQRISVDFHLQTLDLADTRAYISHRLQVAGGSTTIFSPDAVEYVHLQTKGVPRLINQLCDFALLYAFADGRTDVDGGLMMQVVRDRGSGVALPANGQLQVPVAGERERTVTLETAAPQPATAGIADAFELILKTGLERKQCGLAALWIPDSNIELALNRNGRPMATESLKRAQQHLLAWMRQHQRTIVVNRISQAASDAAAPLKILASPVRDASEQVIGVLALFNAPGAPDFTLTQTHIAELLAKKAALIVHAQRGSSADLMAQAPRNA